MKFSSEKRNSIVQYILEKIKAQTPGLSRCVAETFGISANTVHTYLNDLLESNVIRKAKRGQYELVAEKHFYELRRSRGELDSDTYAYDLCLQPHIAHLPDNVQRIWSYAFSEMINNVMDHSGAETLKIVILQDYLSTQTLIWDNGVGIFQKIKEHFHLSNLDEAICELFKGKLTTDEANHSGEGIFFTSKMMDTFLIESDGKIFATTKYDNDTILNEEEVSCGTCVFMSLSNLTHKHARDVFDAYSDDDGSFSKTRIPLKNIFDTAPVSRSQAKRICNRLDQFQEIVLDFADLDWMGQGFAHQIFVVYQNAHPDTTLTPINMNESVMKMYKHVMQSKQS